MCINFISRLIDTARLVDAVITMTSTQLDLSTPLQLFHFFINYYYHHYFFFFLSSLLSLIVLVTNSQQKRARVGINSHDDLNNSNSVDRLNLNSQSND